QLVPGRSLQHWSAYEINPTLLSAFDIPYQDVKYLWEPARFGWVYALGRAFLLTRDEKFARRFWALFEQFEKGNPPYLGPHWMNGQEVAIRLMALVWSAQVFAGARSSTPARRLRLSRAIARHAARIPPTLIYARSQNNNHLITESTALYLAGAVLGYQPWLDLGWRWLNRALQSQISSYGEYIQHSANYHRLVLHSALLADAVRRTRGQFWPTATQQALSRASHWLFSMLDPESGRVPNLGANDGALLLPLSSLAFDDYRPTVQAAARAFLRTGLPPGDWDELSLWLGLQETARTAASSAYAAEHLRSKDSWTYLRASSFKSRLGHMDQLHVDLWWRGRSLASDAGTYLYNAEPPWDNPLVSSRVHNGITIDGRDQMLRAGRFLVLDWFPAEWHPVLSVAEPVLARVAASHRGYDRLGVHHERTVSLVEGHRWQIRDDLRFIKTGSHKVRLHWLLTDAAWSLQQPGAETRLRLRLPEGTVTLVVSGSNPASPLQVTLIRAGRLLRGTGKALPFEGWISPGYGLKVPALSLAVETSASGSFSFTTEFILPK
ncbi:MAG TPA: heparinase II/III family protein, partial [Anaerolineales bacterium]